MRLIFHLAVLSLNCYTLWYDQMYVKIPFPRKEVASLPLHGRVLFLTFWCLVTQTVYFAIAILNDLFGTNAAAPKKPPLIRRIKDTLFSVAFTVALYVSSAFWTLHTINKRFIFPDDNIEKSFPPWLNHSTHTFIAVFILIELLTSRRNYPSRKQGIALVLAFNVVYITFIHSYYFRLGLWPYPFLENFGWVMRSFYFAMTPIISVGVYVLGEKANSLSSVKIKLNYANSKKW